MLLLVFLYSIFLQVRKIKALYCWFRRRQSKNSFLSRLYFKVLLSSTMRRGTGFSVQRRRQLKLILTIISNLSTQWQPVLCKAETTKCLEVIR